MIYAFITDSFHFDNTLIGFTYISSQINSPSIVGLGFKMNEFPITSFPKAMFALNVEKLNYHNSK